MSWTLVWTRHVTLARELVHEVLTRRDAERSDAARAVIERFEANARDVSARFCRGNVLESEVTTFALEYIGFVAATAAPSAHTQRGKTALDRMSAYERSGKAIALALATFLHRTNPAAYVDDEVYTLVVCPLVALTLEGVTAYKLANYSASLVAFESALVHVAESLGPFFEALVEPASSSQVEMVRALRNGVVE